MLTNCPNCGAPIKGYICEYCGTQLKEALVEEPILYADNIPFNPIDVSLVSLYAMSTLYQSQISQMSHYNQIMSANCCVASNISSQLQAANNAYTLESLNAQWQTNIYTYTTTNLDDDNLLPVSPLYNEDNTDLEDSLKLPSDRRLTAEEIRTYVGPVIFVVLIILGLMLRSYLIGV